MTSPENEPLDRRAILKRTLAVNAFWGLDGASHCHDIEPAVAHRTFEPQPGEEFYTMVVDSETGELSFGPVETAE